MSVIFGSISEILPKSSNFIEEVFLVSGGLVFVFIVDYETGLSVHAGDVPEAVALVGRKVRQRRFHRRRQNFQVGHFVDFLFLHYTLFTVEP